MRRTDLFFLSIPLLLTAASSAGCAQVERKFGGAGGGGGAAGAGGAASSSSSTSSSTSSGVSSSSSSSSSTSSSGSTSTSSSSSSSSGGGVESDCTNGIDDDSDGLTDCEDPDCTGVGYQCAAAAPPGWSGPARFYTGAAPPPACGGDWQTEAVVGGLDVVAPPALCSQCSCGAPAGQGCENGALAIMAQDPACMSGPMQFVNYGQCFFVGGFVAQSVRVDTPKALGGQCVPAGGLPSIPPAAYGTLASVCDGPTAVGKGCSGGVCVPAAPPGYGTTSCIYAAGDMACPSTQYTSRSVVYTGIKDTRDCGKCQCGAPAGGVCKTTYDYFAGPFPSSCQIQTGNFVADGTCDITPNPQNPSIRLNPPGPPTGGKCPASGGTPIGGASGSGAITVCCE